MNTHLTDNDIDAIVQYNNGNNAYFKLSSEKAEALNAHLTQCDLCQKKCAESEELYGSIRLKKNPQWYMYSSAAILLICLTLFGIQGNKLNEDNFLSYHDFGFVIKRGHMSDSLKTAYAALLLKEEYDKVIEDCETRQLTENNLHYIAALVLKGQTDANESYIKNALKHITADSLKGWQTKIETISRK